MPEGRHSAQRARTAGSANDPDPIMGCDPMGLVRSIVLGSVPGGDTFVVESNGFDDRVWADADGHPISTDAKLARALPQSGPRYARIENDLDRSQIVQRTLG
jgi:hypothetical protein